MHPAAREGRGGRSSGALQVRRGRRLGTAGGWAASEEVARAPLPPNNRWMGGYPPRHLFRIGGACRARAGPGRQRLRGPLVSTARHVRSPRLRGHPFVLLVANTDNDDGPPPDVSEILAEARCSDPGSPNQQPCTGTCAEPEENRGARRKTRVTGGRRCKRCGRLRLPGGNDQPTIDAGTDTFFFFSKDARFYMSNRLAEMPRCFWAPPRRVRYQRCARRAGPSERAVERVCREAGARVARNVRIADMNIDVPVADDGRIAVLANGPHGLSHGLSL